MGKKQTKEKKAELRKVKEDFIPGAETEEQFEKVLSLLSEWIKAGIVDVEVDTDGDVTFSLPGEMDELLGTQVPFGLKHKDVVSIITFEIPMLIGAGLSRKPKEWIKRRLQEQFSDKIDVMTKRGEKAAKCLVTGDSKERVLLRKASLAYVVDELNWSSGTYHVKSEGEEKIDIPHVSLEIKFARPRSGRMVMIHHDERSISFGRSDDISVTLDLHTDDIRDLIKKLKGIEEDICK